MREFRSSGSVRGALSNGRPYRDVRRSHDFHPQMPQMGADEGGSDRLAGRRWSKPS